MANLYKINQQLENFEFDIDPETGELLNAPVWDDLNMAYEEKIENIACYIKNLKSDITALKAEEQTLAGRRKSHEKKVEYLTKLLSENMGDKKFETPRCAISYRKSTVCEIENEAQFALELDLLGLSEYLRYTAPTVNKTAVKEALKNGVQLGNAKLVDKQNIQIK